VEGEENVFTGEILQIKSQEMNVAISPKALLVDAWDENATSSLWMARSKLVALKISGLIVMLNWTCGIARQINNQPESVKGKRLKIGLSTW
jgi:hypothetical protein